MEKRPIFPMTQLDTLVTTQELQLMKLMLPYIPANMRGILAVYIKFTEFINTIHLFHSTGNVIVEEFRRFQKDVLSVPAVLCKNHGPFTWGKSSAEAVHNSVVLEECAKMAYRTELINPGVKEAPQELIEKHYMRKHGANAYYGQ